MTSDLSKSNYRKERGNGNQWEARIIISVLLPHLLAPWVDNLETYNALIAYKNKSEKRLV